MASSATLLLEPSPCLGKEDEDASSYVSGLPLSKVVVVIEKKGDGSGNAYAMGCMHVRRQ